MGFQAKRKKIDGGSINSLRKIQHLDISLNGEVETRKITTGFEDYYFIHNAVPEIDLGDIDLSIQVFGKKLNLPLMISPITGGIEKTKELNRKLAKVARIKGIAMGVGSQRIAIEQMGSEDTYIVRDTAPDILLFANIGAVQLNYGFDTAKCKAAVDMIEADGLMLHLNPIQEAFQQEGNHDFRGLLSRISDLCEKLDCPVIAREIGFGISRSAAARLIKAGVSGIDVGGAGGTSWIEIEKIRSTNKVLKKVAADFDDWGIPTAKSLRMIAELKPDIPIIASGGIRSGMDIAKAIALGADMAGIALPILRSINTSAEACLDYIEEIETGLKIAMFGIGASTIGDLKKADLIKKKV